MRTSTKMRKLCRDLGKVSRLYKAKTGVGCDGIHPKVPMDLTKETRGEIVEFLEKVEQSGKNGRNKPARRCIDGNGEIYWKSKSIGSRGCGVGSGIGEGL